MVRLEIPVWGGSDADQGNDGSDADQGMMMFTE
jgi:hypothetical protein